MHSKAGYEYLLAYKITIPIYDYTVEFCHRWIDYKSRTKDQMEQAARSGSVNVAEGSKEKSLAMYIKLVGVAAASQEELLKDYQSYARQHKIAIWDKTKAREIGEVREIWEIMRNSPTLPDSPHFPNLPDSPEISVNLMITLVNQANYLLQKLATSLEEKHTREGGFNEKLLHARLQYRRTH
ncbi:MAG TPA: four helix bundle suffix domain-containing protein [Patescibacteria group bacterium]|nr:four helix bundle suffix domain-containing protein [Patescibacteria group bacterium]